MGIRDFLFSPREEANDVIGYEIDLVLGVLALWANSAVLALVVWTCYMALWVWLRRGNYPTIAACREDFHRDGMYQVLSRWLYIEVLPVLVAMHLWRQYRAFLAYQQSLAQLRRLGWRVETCEHADGSLEVHCSTHGPVTLEMIAQSQAIVEEGLQEL
jgi:hypothetical protein